MDAPASAPAPEPPGVLLRALISYKQCFQFSLYWLRQTLCCGGPRPRRDIPLKSAVVPPVVVDFIGDTFYSYALAILILSRFALRVNAPALLPNFQALVDAMVSNSVESLLFVVTQIFTPFVYMAGNIKFNHGGWLLVAWLMSCGTAFFDIVFYRYGLVNPTPLLLRDLHSFFGLTLVLDMAIGLLFTQIVAEEYFLHRCGKSAWSGWPWLRARLPWWTVAPVIPRAPAADVHKMHNPGSCCQPAEESALVGQGAAAEDDKAAHARDMERELLRVEDEGSVGADDRMVDKVAAAPADPKRYPPIDFRFSAQVVSAVVFALVVTSYVNASLFYTKGPIVQFLPTVAANLHNLTMVNTTTTPLTFPADLLYPYAGALSVAAGEFAASADAAFLTAAIMSALAVCFFQVRVLLNFREDVTDGLERPDDADVLAKLQFVSINNAAYFFNYVSASAFMMSAQFFWTWVLLHSIFASSLFHTLFFNWGFVSATLIAVLPTILFQSTLYALVLNDDNQIVYYRWYLWFEMWYFFVGLTACQPLLIVRLISTVFGFYFRWLRSDVPLVIGLDGPYLCYLSVVKIEIMHTLDRCADAAAAAAASSQDAGGKSLYSPPDAAL